VGASFDTVEDQKIFAEQESFSFTLLSDPDRVMGEAYQVVRPAEDPIPAGFPLRITYLISPEGTIAAAWDLNASSSLDEHADEVLAEIAARRGG